MVDIDKVVAAGKLQVDWAAANRYDHNGKALSDLLTALRQSQKRVKELEGEVKAQQSKTVRVWVRVNDKGEAWAKVAENGMYWFMNNHMAQEMFGTLPSKNHEGQYGITTTRIKALKMSDDLKQALEAAEEVAYQLSIESHTVGEVDTCDVIYNLVAAVKYQYDGCICRGESDDTQLLNILKGKSDG